MIDLTKKDLPNVVVINGRSFSIKTDFRLWMRFEIELSKLKPGELIEISYLFDGEMPEYCDISELQKFSRPPRELPRVISHSSAIAFDFELDSDLIYAAFLGQYGIDLTTVEDLHWHKFLALFNGLNEGTKLREVMGYRMYEKQDANNRDIYEDLRWAWEIDRKSHEEQTEIDKFNSYFE